MAMPRNHATGAKRKQSVQHFERESKPPLTEYNGRPVLIRADAPAMAEAFLKECGVGRGLTTWRDKVFEQRADRTMVWDEVIPLDVLTREIYSWLMTCYRNAGHHRIEPFGQPSAVTVANIIRHLRVVLPYLSQGPRCSLAKPYRDPPRVAA